MGYDQNYINRMNQMTGQSFNPNQPAGPILPYANNAQYGPENQGAGNNIWQTDYVGGNDMAGNPINNNINPTNNGLLQVSNPGMEGYGQVPGQAPNFLEIDEEGNPYNLPTGPVGQNGIQGPVEGRPGMFGKQGGFGSGQGFFSKIGQGGEGFMGKFGTGEGKIAQAFGGGNFDMGKAGQALGQGLQNIGANMGQGFQFGGYGQQNRGRY